MNFNSKHITLFTLIYLIFSSNCISTQMKIKSSTITNDSNVLKTQIETTLLSSSILKILV